HGDVLLISHNLWNRRFGGQPDVMGRTVMLEGRPATVLGVLPRGFTFGGQVDAIVPMTLGAAEAAQFSHHFLDMYARLAPGVTPQQAGADLTRLILASHESNDHATGATLVPMKDQVIGNSRTPMLILFGAVGF